MTKRNRIACLSILILFRLWCGWNAFSAVVNFPTVPIESILAQLSHKVTEVDGDPIVHNLAIDHLPEVHVADLDVLPGGCDPHEISRVVCLLPSEGRCPLTLCIKNAENAQKM